MSTSPFRILIVDDNPAIHEDFRKILARHQAPAMADMEALEQLLFDAPAPQSSDQRARFVIDSASQGAEAVAMIEAAAARGEPYAVAFIDVRMPPGMSGIETLAQAWKKDPHLQAVICTAFSDHSWSDMNRALGQTDGFLVLRKPFDPVEVLQVAHALAHKWQLAEQVRRHVGELEMRVHQRTQAIEDVNAALREEIARRQIADDGLRRMATHDSLTGLPNRIALKKRLSVAITNATQRGSSVGVLLVDLDQFKEVNDSYGHPVGDMLLREMALRLQSCVGVTGIVTRMGGDEFVVVLPESSPAAVSALAEKILVVCGAPCRIGPHTVKTPPSIGIAMYPTDGNDSDALLKNADLAMYEAKRSGRATYRCYSAGMAERSREQLELRNALETALDKNELSLWFQPLFDIGGGHIAGVEALLRWNHPTLGMVSPAKFIPAAEKHGLIVRIGKWVLETACRQLASWNRDLGLGVPLTMAVNVSAVQLRSPDFVGTVASVLAETGVNPKSIELEITESTAMDDEEISVGVLHDLSTLGVRIVIDDFGSGYSSLMRLKEMPVNGLKIDRSFVKDIANDPRDAAIVAAMVGMAHALGLTVVAEGVEDPEQLAQLSNLPVNPSERASCDIAQGFLLGKPLPVEAATSLLRSRTSHPSAMPSIVIPVSKAPNAIKPGRERPSLVA